MYGDDDDDGDGDGDGDVRLIKSRLTRPWSGAMLMAFWNIQALERDGE